MEIRVHTKDKEYPVYLERGILKRAREIIGREGHVFLVSDDGVDEKWQKMLKEQYPEAHMHIFRNGEESKNPDTWLAILEDMLAHHVSRKDTVIALGGGVVGDMAGFAAASYMRGIRYINIPTTSLSQIDSSIGGKTAIDLCGIKNCVGAFWQPDMVLVDPDTLSTLSKRHLHNGLAEAVKEGLIKDPGLFEIFEKEDWENHLDEIIYRSLVIKRDVVEKDERESGERKLLNFGHTFGHAYETYFGLDGYYHGECVALGMMKMIENEEIRARLKAVLERLELPSECECDLHRIAELVMNDKKADHDEITIVQVHEIGKGVLENVNMNDIERKLGL
ncbi:MAG: 3-dehydroquinate synthase [Erysipelotrichaceae bacterium]|nr:3-dehydroquinate synthase [Erysipelotrichaceae bacterium]